jgi:hypothetical protein
MALLNAEYTNAINQAMKVGADTAQIEAFYREERRRLEQEDYMARLQEAQEFMGGMSGIWSQMSGIVNQYFTNKSMALNNDMTKEKKAVQNSKMTEEEKKKALEEIDEKYEKKRAELARKQAKFEKVNAIITATINTAQAVTKALGQGGFFGGPAMAAFVGALGAAQIALIAKQPLPEAAQGGIISGSQAGTILRAGEGGRSEAIIPFENPAAMEKMGGMGNTVNVNVQYLFSNDDVPMEIAEKIDRALYRLQQRGNSRFASTMG